MGMFTSDSRPVVASDPELGAQQHFKEECDINNIMKKYVKTGLITHVAENQGRFADVSEVGTYHEAVQRVRDTRKFFVGLPTSVRDYFDNDPALFLDFMADPANAGELRRMGLEALAEEPEDPAVEEVEEDPGEPPEDV